MQDKSIANGRQSEPKDYDRDKAKYEEKHITEESCSQPVPKHPRTDADVQQGQYELKLGEVSTIPKIDFNMETVEYKNLSFHRAEGHRGDSWRGQRRNEDPLLLEGEPVRILGKPSTEGFGEETLGTQTIQTAQKQRLRKSRRS